MYSFLRALFSVAQNDYIPDIFAAVDQHSNQKQRFLYHNRCLHSDEHSLPVDLQHLFGP